MQKSIRRWYIIVNRLLACKVTRLCCESEVTDVWTHRSDRITGILSTRTAHCNYSFLSYLSITLITLVFPVFSAAPAPAACAAALVCVPQPALRGADLKRLLAPQQPEVWPSRVLIPSPWRLTCDRCSVSFGKSNCLNHRLWCLFHPITINCLGLWPKKISRFLIYFLVMQFIEYVCAYVHQHNMPQIDFDCLSYRNPTKTGVIIRERSIMCLFKEGP